MALLGRELGEVLGGLLLEITDARLAAEADQLAFVVDHHRLAHFTEFLIGDDAGGQGVGCGIGGTGGGRKQRGDSKSQQKV